MEQPDKRIIDFISKHHVLTLATVKNNKPWCANCFYSFHKETQTLVFTSDIDTRHIQDLLLNEQVAASIVLETKVIGKIQGIQLEGTVSQVIKNSDSEYKSNYLKRFPFVVLSNTPLWKLQLTYIKFTDNRLGFGKKLIWQKLNNLLS
jgi:uncharacterized protein